MSLMGLYLAVLLFSVRRAEANFGLQTFSQPTSNDISVVALKEYICENTEPAIEFNSNLRNINDDGDKVMDMSFNLEAELTENWMLSVAIDRWNNGDWDKDFYNLDGTVCGLMDQFVPKAWEKFRNQIEPAIPEKCIIEVGHHAISGFTANVEDTEFPVAVAGKYKITSRFLDETKQEMLCQVFEIEIGAA